MKIKKIVKILIVIILLSIIGSSLYMFNKWFFNKYQVVKETNVEETEKRNGKEVIKEPIVTEENKEEKKDRVDRIKATEIYYCDKGATLEGNKCLVKVEIPVVKSEKVISNGYMIESIKQSALIVDALQEVDYSSWEVLTEEEREILAQALLEELEKAINDFEKTAKFSCEEVKGIFETNELPDEDVEYKCTYPAAETKEISNTCLDDTYTLEGDKCKKTIVSSAKVRYECPKSYKLEGTECTKTLSE